MLENINSAVNTELWFIFLEPTTVETSKDATYRKIIKYNNASNATSYW